MTNCKNCGAPLHVNKCEYCGTEYGNFKNCINSSTKKDFGIAKHKAVISWKNYPSITTQLCYK